MSGRFVRLAETGRKTFSIKVDGVVREASEGDTLMAALPTMHDALRDPEFGDGHRGGFCLMSAFQDCWVWTTDGHACGPAPLPSALSGYRAGHVGWRDEEIEIALSRSLFASRGHQLRCALVFPLSIELARHRGTALRARCDRDIRDQPMLVRQVWQGPCSPCKSGATQAGWHVTPRRDVRHGDGPIRVSADAREAPAASQDAKAANPVCARRLALPP